jgi:multimeric flavodoxin WrbA
MEVITMKVVLFNGSPNEKGCTYTALCEVAKELNNAGVTTEIVHIKGNDINAEALAAKALVAEADGIVVGSPVYYASATGSITAFLDKLFGIAGADLALKPAAAVASCRRGGASSTLDQLNKYFTINRMPVVSSNYWNMVHGNVPDEVKQDEEGMQTMRILGKNMAWLIKCIEAGKANGVEAPVTETKIRTNYIR